MSYEAGRRLGDKVDAVVIYYGRTESDPKKLKNLTAPVLGLFAEKDAHITAAGARAFEKSMKSLGRKVEVRVYPGVDHAFANPSGGNYEPQAAQDAWTRTLAFFRAHLPRTKWQSAREAQRARESGSRP
jgi:carboxymethylenebutenolidase